MADDLVLYELRGAVAVVTFNRPDKMNAFTVELEDQYHERLAEAEADPAVRAIVVTGAGRGFCAGADLELLKELASGDLRLLGEHRRPQTYPATLRKPFIAAVNGAAIGAGLAYAVQADIRFVSQTAKLGAAFSQRGLVAEYGMAWLLPRICGQSKALDLLLSSRLVSGDEVLRLGLADRMCPAESVLDEAVAYATEMVTNCSPASLAIIKDMVRRHWDVPLGDAARETIGLMRQSFAGPDVQEGVASYLEQRPSVFAPLDHGTTYRIQF
jgi:enoyl-CoA hydratase/carnithine racemase